MTSLAIFLIIGAGTLHDLLKGYIFTPHFAFNHNFLAWGELPCTLTGSPGRLRTEFLDLFGFYPSFFRGTGSHVKPCLAHIYQLHTLQNTYFSWSSRLGVSPQVKHSLALRCGGIGVNNHHWRTSPNHIQPFTGRGIDPHVNHSLVCVCDIHAIFQQPHRGHIGILHHLGLASRSAKVPLHYSHILSSRGIDPHVKHSLVCVCTILLTAVVWRQISIFGTIRILLGLATLFAKVPVQLTSSEQREAGDCKIQWRFASTDTSRTRTRSFISVLFAILTLMTAHSISRDWNRQHPQIQHPPLGTVHEDNMQTRSSPVPIPAMQSGVPSSSQTGYTSMTTLNAAARPYVPLHQGEDSFSTVGEGGVSHEAKSHGSWPKSNYGSHRITTTQKRSYKRALTRARRWGYTWYRGRIINIKGEEHTVTGPKPLPRTNSNPRCRAPRLRVYSWNAGGTLDAIQDI